MNWQRSPKKNQSKQRQRRILQLVQSGHQISETERMVHASTLAIRAASQRAWDVAGYALIVEGKAVVKVEKGGRRTKVSDIESTPRPEVLILD